MGIIYYNQNKSHGFSSESVTEHFADTNTENQGSKRPLADALVTNEEKFKVGKPGIKALEEALVTNEFGMAELRSKDTIFTRPLIS